MGIRVLAEAIILQSMEDLWDEEEQENAMEFFDGKGFTACAKLADLGTFEQFRLYNMIKRAAKHKRGRAGKSMTLTAV